MDVLKVEYVDSADVALFDLRLSEGELMVYEGCIEYVLQNCDAETIRTLTGCETSEELSWFQSALRDLIKEHVLPDLQLDRYKE